MILKKNNYKIVVLTYIITVFLSCSLQEINNDIDISIDLSLVEENDLIMSNSILNYINEHRAEQNLIPLKIDSLYASAYATQHTKYMIETKTVNHHNFYTRSNSLKARGAIRVSENVAYGFSSAQSVTNAWIASEDHKKVIEGDYTHIGFGILRSETSRKYYYTTLFVK